MALTKREIWGLRITCNLKGRERGNLNSMSEIEGKASNPWGEISIWAKPSNV
jgi:hypothetical protein